MNTIQTTSFHLQLGALDPGSLAAAWTAASVLGWLASLLAWAVLRRC